MEKRLGRPCKKLYDPMEVMEELLSTVNAVLGIHGQCHLAVRPAKGN